MQLMQIAQSYTHDDKVCTQNNHKDAGYSVEAVWSCWKAKAALAQTLALPQVEQQDNCTRIKPDEHSTNLL